jgi:hypothetical protein
MYGLDRACLLATAANVPASGQQSLGPLRLAAAIAEREATAQVPTKRSVNDRNDMVMVQDNSGHERARC